MEVLWETLREIVLQNAVITGVFYGIGVGAVLIGSIVFEKFYPTLGATSAHVFLVSLGLALIWPVLLLFSFLAWLFVSLFRIGRS